MSSNIKPKSSGKEAPTEPFKRAVGVCLRAISGKGDLEVSFASERPGLVGGKARLPEPPRRLNEREAAIVRGHADSIALRLACHDPSVHRKLAPGGQQARAVFEAVEQARVEAIGARRMGGVAKNLAAMLDDRFHRGKFDDITDRADAPIEEALAMMVRERLTGETPPPTARKLVDLWRPLIEERAGRSLDRLERVLNDQRRFGDVVHDLLDSLDMGEDRSSDSDEDEGDEGEDENQKDESGEDGEASDAAESDQTSAEAEASADELPDSASEAVDAPSAVRPSTTRLTVAWAVSALPQGSAFGRFWARARIPPHVAMVTAKIPARAPTPQFIIGPSGGGTHRGAAAEDAKAITSRSSYESLPAAPSNHSVDCVSRQVGFDPTPVADRLGHNRRSSERCS
jgi:cobaltochelatase CobT